MVRPSCSAAASGVAVGGGCVACVFGVAAPGCLPRSGLVSTKAACVGVVLVGCMLSVWVAAGLGCCDCGWAGMG